MAGNRFGVPCLRILPQRVFLTFPPQNTSMPAEGGAGAPRASSDHNEFLFGFRRHRAHGIFASLIKNQNDRFPKIAETLFASSTLTISAGHFGAVRDVPLAIPF